MAQTVGFIGLGIMGRPMARNLIKAGYPLVVHSRSRGPVDELVGVGAKAASSSREVASQVDVLITMLPNSPDVELVALGKDGIIEGARRGLLFLDMSTISPLVSQKVGRALGDKGVRMLDAPVSGGEGRDRRRALDHGRRRQGRFRRRPAGVPGHGQDDHPPGPARRRRIHQAREPDHRRAQPDRARRGAHAGAGRPASTGSSRSRRWAAASPARGAWTRRHRTTSPARTSRASRSTCTSRTSA